MSPILNRERDLVLVKRRALALTLISTLLISLLLVASVPSLKAADETLQLEWQQSLPGISGQRIIQTSDGDYLVLGKNATIHRENNYTTANFVDYIPILEKIDSGGKLLWYRTYKVQGVSPELYALIETSDGGYALAGGVVASRDSVGYAMGEFCILKLDSEGNMLWSKTYRNPQTLGHADFTSLLQANNGSYVLVGDYDYSAAYTYGKYMPILFFAKVDFSGKLLLNKTIRYGGTPSILQSSDQGYTILASYPMSGGGSHCQLIATDLDGTMQCEEEYTKEDSTSSRMYCCTVADDGGFLVGGSYISLYSNPDYYGWLFKTDSQGKMLWNRTYHNSSCIYSIMQVNDGGYLFCGSWEGGWIAKTDSLGNIEAELETGLGVPYHFLRSNDGGYVCVGTWNESSEASIYQKFWIAEIGLTEVPDFPVVPVATASIIAAVVGVGLLVYFKKRKH